MSSPSPHFLAARGAGKCFAGGVEALRGLDFDIAAGQFTALVGPSGCGKSTLLRLVAGLEELSSGTLLVAGLPPLEARRRRRDLAFVFQDPTLLPWRTVERNVALPLELERRPRSRSLPVREALELVGLGAFARAFPAQLSGGMRMRVSLARALVTRPGLLLMDEPFGALDEITRQRLNEELLRLWARDGWTGLFVTHHVSEALFLGQKVMVMSARPGRLLAQIEVPFPYPRAPELRAAPEFGRLAAEISRHLRRSAS